MTDKSTLLFEHHLKELRLPCFLREYGKLTTQCAAENVDHPQYQLRLAELELIDRHRRMVGRRIRAARFPAAKGLGTFDFPAIPSVNKALVTELARCGYIQRRENVISVGNSGTGKTYIALGLGLAARQRGLSVGFTTAAAPVHELMETRDERRLLNLQRQPVRLNLLIIDELGFVPLPRTGAELLFDIFSQRYERGSTLVTNNLPFRRMGGSLLLGASHRSAAGPANPPRAHPGDERRELPAQAQPREGCAPSSGRPKRRLTPSSPSQLPPRRWSTIPPPQWSALPPPLTHPLAVSRFIVEQSPKKAGLSTRKEPSYRDKTFMGTLGP